MTINDIIEICEQFYTNYLMISQETYDQHKEIIDQILDKFPIKLIITPYILTDNVYLVPKEINYGLWRTNQ